MKSNKIGSVRSGSKNQIIVRGACEHNLKNIDLKLPRDALVVFSGVSGSGKSSLAFDTLFKEGQRRFLESLSPYARQFLGGLDKPRVEHVEGLSAAIAIDQKTVNRNPRSTVGTVTELYDHYRLLMARLGKPHCPSCGIEVSSLGAEEIVNRLLVRYGAAAKDAEALLLAPMVRERKGEYRKELQQWREEGYLRVRVDGKVGRLDEEHKLERYEKHSLELVWDRLPLSKGKRSRWVEGVEKCLQLSGGLVGVLLEGAKGKKELKEAEMKLFSSEMACPRCQTAILELEPRLFSFNDAGACRTCGGLGYRESYRESRRGSYRGSRRGYRHLVGGKSSLKQGGNRHQSSEVCQACDGSRLNKVALAVLFQGLNMASLTQMTLSESRLFFDNLSLSEEQTQIGKDILREVSSRLEFLCQVGVGYLTVERRTNTLSGGESQRIRLASQVGSRLQGVLYVLDEPSIGLHAADQQRLLDSLGKLKNLGNTVCVVEHDTATMVAADHLVDMGPGAGNEGGRVLAQGSLSQVMRSRVSVSASYLRGDLVLPKPAERRVPAKYLMIKKAHCHNLRQLDINIPLGVMCVISGVSGSGKSTLVHEVLKPAVRAYLNRQPLSLVSQIKGLQELNKVIEISQTPIGRTPRSNAATYTKLMDVIRDLFTRTRLARMRGYKAGRFSFNVKGGRCEICKGGGVRVIEMQFLSNVEVVCEACQGRRFNEETLQVRYKQHHIQSVLGMTVDEAQQFFSSVPEAKRILNSLVEVGLGYLVLGQPSTTLSGGEAQRLKLASELRKKPGLHTLYLLDEPTTGLHGKDVFNLLSCLHGLVEAGHSVVVIEHNLDVLNSADWILDLGPHGGDQGGKLVAEGPPEVIAEHKNSLTGLALKEVLKSPLGNWKPDKHPADGNLLAKKAFQPSRDILVWGAENNNLQNIDVRLPKNKLTVLTGVSGCGKSSLALDTLFAEGQARYVESLSTYARRFLGRMDKPRVRSIEGLSPAIAIDQKHSTRTPRSTVATATEIYDYLRIIYARLGQPHCPHCQAPLKAFPAAQLTQLLLLQSAESGVSGSGVSGSGVSGSGVSKKHLLVCTPMAIPAQPEIIGKAALKKRLDTYQAEGFTRLWQSAPKPQMWELEQYQPQRTNQLSQLHIVIDRLKCDASQRQRLDESITTAYKQNGGLVSLVKGDDFSPDAIQKSSPEVLLFSEHPTCLKDGITWPELSPRQFSFNSPHGACPTCEGLGNTTQLDWERWVINPKKPLFKGALRPSAITAWFNNPHSNIQRGARRIARRHRIYISKAAKNLLPQERLWLMEGDGQLPGINTLLSQKLAQSDESHKRDVAELLNLVACPACQGSRLMPLARNVRWQKTSIAEFCQQTVSQAKQQLEQWQLSENEALIAKQPRQEIYSRLIFLENVGLGHLHLHRRSSTLSGGEAQRIRLASQLGAQLVGVLYVLDEPTIGLHPRDTQQLLNTLDQLKRRGNTICVVEHDPQVIKFADHLIDIGPAAGRYGGQVVAQGTPRQVAAKASSLTGQYLSGRRMIPLPAKIRPVRNFLQLKNVSLHNLKNVQAKIPLQSLVAVSGVSGSGKSTLIHQVLRPLLENHLGTSQASLPAVLGSLSGFQSIERLLVVDQTPIGRTPRSNPATYMGLMSHLRTLMAAMPQARARGYSAGRFSFNMPSGRCTTCEGRGFLHIEMHFLADVWTKCPQCKGKRYNQQTLQITFKGYSIADILQLEVQPARSLFANQPQIKRGLETLAEVGLGYIQLGQAANTLSGGEAQRLKLAAELNKLRSLPTLYLFDEPTTGLHSEDVCKLLAALHRIVDQGHSVVVIEHNLEVLKTADFILDLGPEEGELGGEIVAMGTPQEICQNPASHTGKALKALL